MEHVTRPQRGDSGASDRRGPFIRSAMMVVIAGSLLPILLGGVAENEQLRREMFRKMREEHMRRVAEQRMRFVERRREREHGAGAGLPSISSSTPRSVR